MSNSRVEELKKQISDLKNRWPKHSVPPALVQQLDELEEELEREEKALKDKRIEHKDHLQD